MREIEFEGEVHEFPDDFTDADISKALGPAAPAQPMIPHEPGYAERVVNRYAAIPGRLASGAWEAIKPGGTFGGHLMGGLEVLGALAEPVVAPAGEATRELGHAAVESFLKTGIAPGMEGFAPEPVDVSNVTPEGRKTLRGATGEAYAVAGELAAGLGRPVANIAAKAGLRAPLLANKVTPLGHAMIAKVGYGGVRPAQVTESSLTNFLDNIASASMLGRGKILKQTRGSIDKLETIADDFARGMGQQLEKPVLGEVVRGIISEKDAAWRAAGNDLYRQVDQIHPEPAVNLQGVYEAARRMSNEFPEGTEAGNLLRTVMAQTKPTIQAPAMHPMMRTLAGLPPEAPTVLPKVKTFLEANDLRSWTYAWKTPGLTSANDQAVRVGTVMGKAIDQAIDDAGQFVNPAARAQLDLAGKHWKAGSEKFNHRLVRALLIDGKVTPEDVVGTFLRPGAITETRRLREIVGGPESAAWGKVRRSFVEDMLAKSHTLDVEAGRPALDANKLRGVLDQWGPETTREVLGPAHGALLGDLADALIGMQKTIAGGGGMMIQMKQAGIIGAIGAGALAGGIPAAGVVTFVLAPDMLARIFTSEKATHMLLTGLRAQYGSATARRAVSVLSNFLNPGRRQSQEPTKSELQNMFDFKEGNR